MIAKAFEMQNKSDIKALTHAVGYREGWTDWVWTNVLKNRR